MDVQGYEVKILKGAKRLLAAGAIGIIKSELTEMFLAGQGSSAIELLRILEGYGFELYSDWYTSDPVPIEDGSNYGEVILRRKPDLPDKQETQPSPGSMHPRPDSS